MSGGGASEVGGSCRVRAPAKLNLCLSVAGPEPAGGPKAGWHRISSWFAAIDVCDEVVVTRLREGEASRYRVRWGEDAPRPSAIDWTIEKDLAVRAHRLLEERVGRSLAVELEVVKRIPVGGGLGGGSSDAAAALVAIDRVFGLGLGRGALREVGARLGSDVGFFVAGAPAAMVGGFGDQIEAVAGVGGRVTLVVPTFGCATPEVYRAYDTILSEEGRPGHEVEGGRVRAAHAASVGARGVQAPLLFNDLLSAAERVRPEVRVVREAAELACARAVHLTGSGSCLFIIGGVAEVLRGVKGLEGCAVLEAEMEG